MSIDTPLVSVIMPAYNQEDFIQSSIESVLSQTYSNWELVVINDGSTDRTKEVVESFSDQRIILINQENQGVSKTRNNGLAASKGELIAFLDADDLWLPKKLEKQVQQFQTLGENVGFIHAYYTEFDNRGEYSPKPFKHLKGLNIDGDVKRSIVIHDFVATLTVMIKREVLESIGDFDTTLSGPEDWDLWIRIAQKYQFGFIAEPLARYRLSASGLSKNYEKFEGELKKVLDRYLLTSDFSKKDQQLGLWLYYRHMAHGYARGGKICHASKRLLQTIQQKPFRFSNLLSTIYTIIHSIKFHVTSNEN